MRAISSIACGVAILAACGGQEPPAKPPAAPPPPSDPAWISTVASSCAKIASCSHSHDTPRLRDPGACVDWWIRHEGAGAPDPLQKCLGDAKTCDQVNACMHGSGDPRAVAFCAQRPGVVSGCESDRLVSCGDDSAQESSIVDCASMGASCRETKAAGGLVIRACFSSEKCPQGAPEARCDGNAVLSCRDGAVERVACRPGTRCEERRDESSGEAAASCELPGGRRCDLLGARRCDADRLIECEGRGHVGKVSVTDCSSMGLRCAGTGPRAGCYVPAKVECDKEMLPRCERGKLVFCAAGRVTKISCEGIGLGTCDPAARGPMAACSDTPNAK